MKTEALAGCKWKIHPQLVRDVEQEKRSGEKELKSKEERALGKGASKS